MGGSLLGSAGLGCTPLGPDRVLVSSCQGPRLAEKYSLGGALVTLQAGGQEGCAI